MLTIHGVPVSVHTRKVILAALEKRVPFRNEPVIPFHPPEGWRELSPTGKIPVATEGDTVLRDSAAICAYLERAHPEVPLYPARPADYAHALWLEAYAGGTLFRDVVHGLFFQKVISPRILKGRTDGGEIERILGEVLPGVLGYLESACARDFLAGEGFSIADIAVASNLVNFHYLGYQLDRGSHPRLEAWFRRQLRRPSLSAALAAERPYADSMGLDASFVDYLGLAA